MKDKTSNLPIVVLAAKHQQEQAVGTSHVSRSDSRKHEGKPAVLNALQALDGLIESLSGGSPPGPGAVVKTASGLHVLRSHPHFPVIKIGCEGMNLVATADDRIIIARELLPHLMLARAELLVLQSVFGERIFDFNIRDQFNFLRHISGWTEQVFISHAKYHTACPMAHLLQNDLPPRPATFTGGWLVWTGNVKQFLKNHLNCQNGRPRQTSLRLAQGILQGVKRGCAQVSDKFVAAELAAHREILTREPIHDYDEVFDYFALERGLGYSHSDGHTLFSILYNELVHGLTKKSKDSLGKPVYTRKQFEWTPEDPSSSASFGYSRSDGGAYRSVLEHYGLKPVAYQSRDMFGRVVSVVRNETLTYEQYCRPFIICRCMDPDPNCPVCPMLYDPDDVDDTNNRKKILVEADTKLLECEVIPICEPLKVRVITKTDGVSQWFVKPLQQQMKALLDKFPQFRLTNRPLSVTDLYDLESKTSQMLSTRSHPAFLDPLPEGASFVASHPGWFWVSGDYKGATDRLNIHLSSILLDVVCDALEPDPIVRRVARRVLLHQRLNYPKKHGIEPGDQKNGQLMGSILSFPILCLANLLCYWKALNCFLLQQGLQPVREIKELPVLINGDDILFLACPKLYKHWGHAIGRAEFVLSVGKNYVHESVLTVNSTCYVRRETGFHLIKYLNVGLLIGQSKTGPATGERPLWDIHNQVVEGSPNPLQTTKHFLHYNLPLLEKLTSKGLLNCYLSRPLGGLGFIHPDKSLVKLTAYQCALATHRLQQFQTRPSRLTEVTFECKTKVKLGWQATQVFNRGEKVLLPFGPRPRWVPRTHAEELKLQNINPNGENTIVYRPLRARDLRLPKGKGVDPLPKSVILDYSEQFPLSTFIEVDIVPLEERSFVWTLGDHCRLRSGLMFPLCLSF